MRKCSVCGVTLTPENWPSYRKRNYICNPCHRTMDKKYRPLRREWAKRNADKRLNHERKTRGNLVARVFAAYGNKCACCGESIPQFLTIDHINGDGRAHRIQLGSHSRAHLFRAIIKEGFPKDRYQLLCWNCNCTKGFLGYCPHQLSHH